MPIPAAIAASRDELSAIYRDLHAHPELGFEETRTAGIVAEKLRGWGVDEITTGVGGTGVVARIRGTGGGNRSIGLRADMDALPIEEASGVPFASTTPGVMHACGHDGHTTMLLGAAKYLAATRGFDGTVTLIFQPAEEGLGGARRMIEEGLFDRFPCDELFGIHNMPMTEPGQFTVCPGPAMAGAEFFDITLTGQGSHAAMPHQARDPLVAAASLVGEIQTILGRNIAPLETCVLSLTQIHAGSAYNIVPGEARLAGTIRYFKDAVRDVALDRLRALSEGWGVAHGITVTLETNNIFDVLVNDGDLADAYVAAAAEVVDTAEIRHTPMTGSEDFADMLQTIPGAYGLIGHQGKAALHNPGFVLDEACLAEGAAIFARIAEQRLG